MFRANALENKQNVAWEEAEGTVLLNDDARIIMMKSSQLLH